MLEHKVSNIIAWWKVVRLTLFCSKVELSGNDLINWWLLRYHKTNIEYEFACNPKYKSNNDLFYRKFMVTQKQHDRWYKWFNRIVDREHKKRYGFARTKSFGKGLIYLNVSPMVEER